VQQKEAGRSQVAARATAANEAIENFFMFYPFKDLQGVEREQLYLTPRWIKIT
jgi:hypothetical protein